MAYFRTDFSYIQPIMQLIESYVMWLNITKEITFVFTNKKGNIICILFFRILSGNYLPDADQAVTYLTSRESSLRAIVLYRLTSNEIEQIKNTKIGIRHVALIGNDLEEHLKTVSTKTIVFITCCLSNLFFSFVSYQIQQEHLIKHEESWIIVTDKTSGFELESSALTLVEFTSWKNGHVDGTTRAKTLLEFIRYFLNRVLLNRPDFNCDANPDDVPLRNLQKEISNIISSVRKLAVYNL